MSVYNLFPVRARQGTSPITHEKEEGPPLSLTIRYPGQAAASATQAIGGERTLESKGHTFKGAGQRDPLNTTFMRIGVQTAGFMEGVLKPFDIYKGDGELPTHLLLGGASAPVLQHEFDQTMRLLEMIQMLGVKVAGLPRPVRIHHLDSFPVIYPDGKIVFIDGREYFMDPKLMSPAQRLKITSYVLSHEHDTSTDRAVAEAFMRLFQPAVYEYKGAHGPRVGTVLQIVTNHDGLLRDLLVEAGAIGESAVTNSEGTNRIRVTNQKGPFAINRPISPVDREAGMQDARPEEIKKIIDEAVLEMYAKEGLQIQLPDATDQNLALTAGRINYLKELGRLNPKQAQKLRELMAERSAKQLGVIHGSGGHVGGGQDNAWLGVWQFRYISPNGTEYIRTYTVTVSEDTVERIEKKERWIGIPPSEEEKRTLVLKKIVVGSSGDTYPEMGPPGGGSTRSDNVGSFGLRDFDTLCLEGEDPNIDSLLNKYSPDQNLDRNQLKHFLIIYKQAIDLAHLFIGRPRLAPAPYPGTFMHFVMLTGGDINDYLEMKYSFMQAYLRTRKKAVKKLAPKWFRGVEAKKVEYLYADTLDPLGRQNCAYPFPDDDDMVPIIGQKETELANELF